MTLKAFIQINKGRREAGYEGETRESRIFPLGPELIMRFDNIALLSCTWRRQMMMMMMVMVMLMMVMKRQLEWHWWRLLLWWWALPLLLLVANPSCFGLQITNLSKVQPHRSSSKRIRFRLPSVLFESGSEAADERVQATPRLPERARTRRWRVRVAVEGADRGVHFGLPKLVQVPTKPIITSTS